MIIKQLISPIVPTLIPTDTGSKALIMMEEGNIHQIPLVSDDKYVALVQESDLLDWEMPESALSMAKFLNYRPAVFDQGHPFEAMRLAHLQHLSIVPVVDAENRYIGSITKDDLLTYITENSGLDNPGGIVVIEVDARDYSLSEIARICESEETIIISSQLITNKLTGKIEITLKTNRTHLNSLASSFERHDYKVLNIYGEQKSFEDAQERYDLLMNYINM